MCVNPITFQGTVFRCSKCWQCKRNKVQDWVGRCIAESRVSTRTLFVTLTYGGGDIPSAAILTYSDVQKYLKRMRFAGYKFKYLIAGEYGTQKGRAHWHVIFFFDGETPEWDHNKDIHCPYWVNEDGSPKGYVFVKDGHLASFKYVCKYVVKSVTDEHAQAYITMSRRPFVGRDYFAILAQQYVDMGLSPKNLYYRFDESKDKKNNCVQHYMHGAVGKYFLAEYVERFALANGEFAEYPSSQLVDDYLDSISDYLEPLRYEARRYGVRPYFLPEGCDPARWSERANTFVVVVDGERYLWVNRETDGSIGIHAWRSAQGKIIERLQRGPQELVSISREPTRYEQLLQRLDKNTGLSDNPKGRERLTFPMVGERSTNRRSQYLDAVQRKFLINPDG